jgi:hypothetical protein
VPHPHPPSILFSHPPTIHVSPSTALPYLPSILTQNKRCSIKEMSVFMCIYSSKIRREREGGIRNFIQDIKDFIYTVYFSLSTVYLYKLFISALSTTIFSKKLSSSIQPRSNQTCHIIVISTFYSLLQSIHTYI